MQSDFQNAENATTETRKPWQTPTIILGEARDSQKDALTIETTFAGPS